MARELAKAVGARLKAVREDFKSARTIVKFAKALGIGHSTYYNYERGDSEAPLSLLMRVSEVTGCDLEWLTTGSKPSDEPPVTNPDTIGDLKSLLREAIVEYLPSSGSIPGHLQILGPEEARQAAQQYPRSVAVPILPDAVAVRCPRRVRDIDEAMIMEYAVVPREWIDRADAFVCTRISGDSMLPILSDGSLAGISLSQRDPKRLHDKLVLFRIGPRIEARRLQLTSRYWILKPANPEYDDMVFEATAEDLVQIIGKITWSLTRFD